MPCTQPHPTDIVSLPRYPGPPGNDFPPIPELYRQSFALCEAAFKTYTGTTPDQTPARPGAVLPEGRNGVSMTNPLQKAWACIWNG